MSDALRSAARRAESLIHGRYLEACQAAGRPLSPRELGLPRWCEDYLDETYEALLHDPDWQPED